MLWRKHHTECLAVLSPGTGSGRGMAVGGAHYMNKSPLAMWNDPCHGQAGTSCSRSKGKGLVHLVSQDVYQKEWICERMNY